MSLRELLFGKAPQQLPSYLRAIEDRGGVRVLRVQGAIGKEIAAEIKPAEERDDDRLDYDGSLLIDLTDAAGSDFSTVSYLVLVLRERMARSGRVGLLNPSPQLLTELKLARVDALFPVFDSEESALRELGGGTAST